MRKLLMVTMVLCAAGQAYALTPFGPPVAALDPGQFTAGFGYSYSEFDIEVDALGITFIAPDQKVSTYMANLGFGLLDDLELQVDIGGSGYDVEGAHCSGEFAFGLGLKSTFAEADNVKWGASVFAHWYQANPSGVYLGVPWSEDNEWVEIQLAVGPSYTKDGFCIYGGPFLHFIDGEGDAKMGGIEIAADWEQKEAFGGFFGAKIDLNENTTLGVEYLFTGSAYGFGASIIFGF